MPSPPQQPPRTASRGDLDEDDHEEEDGDERSFPSWRPSPSLPPSLSAEHPQTAGPPQFLDTPPRPCDQLLPPSPAATVITLSSDSATEEELRRPGPSLPTWTAPFPRNYYIGRGLPVPPNALIGPTSFQGSHTSSQGQPIRQPTSPPRAGPPLQAVRELQEIMRDILRPPQLNDPRQQLQNAIQDILDDPF